MDRKKLLDMYSKSVAEGLPFADDFIKPELDNDIANNALIARNLSEEALARQVLKNTGVPIPDVKTAPKSKMDDFFHRIMQERYPELKADITTGDIKDQGSAGWYNPVFNKIVLDENIAKEHGLESAVGTLMHEAGHQYDDKHRILGPDGKPFASKELDLGALRKARDSGIDLKSIDSAQVYDIYAKGHHQRLPNLRDADSFGLGALKSVLKTGGFRALPAVAAASQITPAIADLKEGNPNTAAARMVTSLAPAGADIISDKLLQDAQFADKAPELQDPSYIQTLKNIGERRANSGKSPIVESFSGQKIDTSATSDSDMQNRINAIRRLNSQG